ncbi:MAG: anthranilate synthase component I family protein [Vampirovibrionales bacterium]|nr:anthranilate synthase component I family protein [Vampirovibrionales bacterium]
MSTAHTQSNHQSKTNRMMTSWLADTQTPAMLFEALGEQSPMGFLLESADGDKRLARFSILGVLPRLVARLELDGWHIEDAQSQEVWKEEIWENGVKKDPMKVLQDLQERYLPNSPDLLAKDGHLPDLPFYGGWVGYWGYGLPAHYEQIPQQTKDPLGLSDAYLALYDTVLVFDHLYRQLHLIGDPKATSYQACHSILQASAKAHVASGQGLLPIPSPVSSNMSLENAFDGVEPSMSKDAYCQKVKQIKAWIEEGQAFQVVLAQRFSLAYQQPPFNAYRLLLSLNPSPYAYYLKFPDFVYFGASPETCVSYEPKTNTVTLRALAGTRHRGATPQEDVALAEELKANAKEMAEHRMLVDLARNDLGKVSVPGSVCVGEIAQVVHYTHVMHLSTEVKGQLREGLSAYDVLPCCFPRGTVSGAPKIRAMQLLSELEPERRGIYAGMVGYLGISGELDGAIAIRSALVKNQVAHVQAGAGVVFDSSPEGEYEETRNKARSVLTALQLAKILGEAR